MSDGDRSNDAEPGKLEPGATAPEVSSAEHSHDKLNDALTPAAPPPGKNEQPNTSDQKEGQAQQYAGRKPSVVDRLLGKDAKPVEIVSMFLSLVAAVASAGGVIVAVHQADIAQGQLAEMTAQRLQDKESGVADDIRQDSAIRAAQSTADAANQALGLTAQGIGVARDQLAASGTALQVQERSYVLLVGAQIQHLAVGEKPQVLMNFQNTGRSPARNLRIRTEIGLYPVPPPEDFVLPLTNADQQNASVLARDGIQLMFPTMAIEINQAMMDAIRDQTHVIRVIARVTYEDGFGVNRETVVRLRSTGDGEKLAPYGDNHAY